MTNFVLPSEAAARAVDLSTLIISGDTPGLLTPWFGALVKSFVDQMSETEVLHIRAPNSSTGKTEKFILENHVVPEECPTIVTTDYFTDMILPGTGFNTVIDHSDRVYRNVLNPWRTAPDAANTSPVVSAEVNHEIKNAPADDTVTVDLSASPAPMSDAQVLAQALDANINPGIVRNANGQPLGTADEDFSPVLGISFGMDTGKGYPEWDARRKLMDIPSLYNNLPVNGALLVLNYSLAGVQAAVTRLTGALDGAGKTYEMVTYSPADGEAINAVALKKLSA